MSIERSVSATAFACLIISLLVFSPASVSAQSAPSKKQVREVSESYDRQLRAYFAVSGLRAGFESGIEEAAAEIAEEPGMEGLLPVLEEFFETYITWDRIEDSFVLAYARHFSQDEFTALLAGDAEMEAKLDRLGPVLEREGEAVGEALVLGHQAELQTMIMEFMAGTQQEGPPQKKKE